MSDESPLYLVSRVTMVKGGGGVFIPHEGEHALDVRLMAATDALDAEYGDTFAVWRVTDSVTADQAQSLIRANTPESLATVVRDGALLELGQPPFKSQYALHAKKPLDPAKFTQIRCGQGGCTAAQAVSRAMEPERVQAAMEEGGWSLVQGKGWFCPAHGGGA